MSNEAVLVERESSVTILTLNRPEQLNALDNGMREGLAEALAMVARERDVRVALITGAGRAFCTGADIDQMTDLKLNHHSATFREYLERGHELVRQIRSLHKPVLASVNGPAAGAGMNLALACDLRIASDRASFSQTFVRIGLHPDWGGTFFLPRLVGVGRAMEMFALADPMNADEACRIGLVNAVCAHDRLAEEARALARRLAQAPPLPLALLKQALYERLETELGVMMEHEVYAQMKCFDSEDFREGLRALREKREPNFRGV
jgi:2-(1,2-epoxy-1,2-dihydrophenyl)acetyl-CoA isomerase